MRWILDLDISLLVCGIARKHGIVPKTIFGAPSILPPPQKFHFLLRPRVFLRKRVCGFSNWQFQENVFNHANLFGGGAIFMFPPINPQNPVSSRQRVKEEIRNSNCRIYIAAQTIWKLHDIFLVYENVQNRLLATAECPLFLLNFFGLLKMERDLAHKMHNYTRKTFQNQIMTWASRAMELMTSCQTKKSFLP
jgi:hypothetical protein